MAAVADSAIAAACAAGAWVAGGERHVGQFSRHVRQLSSTSQREVYVHVRGGLTETCHVSIARRPLVCFRRRRIRHQRVRQALTSGGGERASKNALSGLSRCCVNNENASRSRPDADVDNKPIQSDVEKCGSGEASEALTITLSVASSVSMVDPKDWDACAADAAGKGSFNPVISHAFFSSLEDSKSAVKGEGWYPQHLVAKDSSGKVVGVAPLYLKSHSYGEYVFDNSWARAFMQCGIRYYPKLQSCVPFTPVTGPRLLVREGPFKEQVFLALSKSMVQIAEQLQVSSVHVTFPTKSDWERMGELGFLRRLGVQYHWENNNYASFDDFLMDLKQSRRKTIRQERKKIKSQGLILKRLRGDDIKADHWDSFNKFYRHTTDQKWGQVYLTREFFHMIGSRMGDQVMLIIAEDGVGRMVGGALNFVGEDSLFGRNWGCRPGTYYDCLHFEACYYQAIECAIELGLKRVEAGAQGEHKIQRGYLPSLTYSAHHICHEEFRNAIADFLQQEAFQVDMEMDLLNQCNPFKDKTNSSQA